MLDFTSKETLEKVLTDLKDKKDNNIELDQTEQENYSQLVQSFYNSVTDKLADLKEGEIAFDIKSQIESRLEILTSNLEAMTLEETILKIEEMKGILDFEIDVVSNTSIKNIEQLIAGTEFVTELSELSEIIKQNEEIKKDDLQVEKQDTSVQKLFDPGISENLNKDKSILSDNDYLEINVGSKTKKFFGKARDWMKNAGSKVKDVVWSPFGAVAGAGVGIPSLFSKKFRKGVGKVIGAPFSAIGGGVQKVGNFVVNLVTYPFRWLGGLFRGKKVEFNKTGTTDKFNSDNSDVIPDNNNPDSFFGGDSIPDTSVADTTGNVSGAPDTSIVDTAGNVSGTGSASVANQTT